ncbi:alpha-isopropylmalate synthase regulatory domain-containing protein [Persicobacter diffluens]|uniref:2-isopropylmalate synthase n=1 Tax=Persicobacter diffluens TaxID=981 RepID=A0AAN5AM21_9BACT|nr:2-isopropylmalate synthase [Persicobacter diffluens]
MKLEILDTTLRDGEQTSGVAYTPGEKLTIAKLLLEEVGVDRIEIASARISEGEAIAVTKITEWAANNGYSDQVEILGFIDGGKSLNWIQNAGGRVINLLCKGSLHHLKNQLKKSISEHIADIKREVKAAVEADMIVNLYLEDWSNGMKNSPDYVFELMEALRHEPIKRFMLPDTLGILNPLLMAEYLTAMQSRFPGIHFDSHCHNDYDLAVGNTFAAIQNGINGLHCTVNGLGERTGNTPLASIIGLRDHLDFECNVQEKKLNKISQMVAVFSGIETPHNQPLVGKNVFTQACGVHADGDAKGNLYKNELLPERFGRKMEYALGKTSGKASIQKNLEDLGISLSSEKMNKVTRRVVELGDKKSIITQDDLPYIVSDVLGNGVEGKVKILNYYCTLVHNMHPVTMLKIEIDGKVYEETATGDGLYDAFMNAVRKIYEGLSINLPILTNYRIHIPPGGNTDALVENIITWSDGKKEFKTRGLEADQQAAAISATLKMLNKIHGEDFSF